MLEQLVVLGHRHLPCAICLEKTPQSASVFTDHRGLQMTFKHKELALDISGKL